MPVGCGVSLQLNDPVYQYKRLTVREADHWEYARYQALCVAWSRRAASSMGRNGLAALALNTRTGRPLTVGRLYDQLS